MVKNSRLLTLAYKVTKTSEKKDGTDTPNFANADITLATPSNVVLELNAGVANGEVGLKFTLQTTTTDKAETAGEYTGTVTYTAAVVANK